MSTEYDWMEEARQLAAQCWCDPETEDREMDAALAEAVARRIAAWMGTAAQNQRNTDYYRGLVVECGKAIGHAAYMQDDGGVTTDVLCDKVPGLVASLQAELSKSALSALSLEGELRNALAEVERLTNELTGGCCQKFETCTSACVHLVKHLKSWKESMEKDLAKYRELAIAAIDVTILAEECEGDDGEQVFTVNGERFTRLNDLADFFSADGTASILPDAEDSTQPKAQLDPDGNLAGPDFEDGPEFEGWEQRSGQPKSVEQCRDDGRCQYAIDHGAEGMGHCPPDKCCMPCTCDIPESICKAHYTTAKLSGEPT